MKRLLEFISTLFILILAAWFVKWYIKGHFGKYRIYFWLNTILALILWFTYPSIKPKENNEPGYVYWERNIKTWE